jgi:DNA/RNA-binding domain of Phe-tRNA-synthetase-like protein
MLADRRTFTRSDSWKARYPGAAVGVLAMHAVANPPRHAGLDVRKDELENELRARFTGEDRAALRATPVVHAYDAYYKQFGKTYHVQLQLESIAFKGKQIPRVAALVEAMFMAELKNQMLTAGHDADALAMPIGVDVSDGSQRYVRIDGREQELKPGDMMISDARGVVSSILYGPDRRTRIRPGTERVLFTVYAPPGIDRGAVRSHLEDIRANVSIVSPDAQVDVLQVYGAE